MSISWITRKWLWSNAGGRCAFPDCDQPLVVPTEGAGDAVIVGKECHIVAQGDAGPRAVETLGADEAERWRRLVEERDGYANLILLCGVHHDVIDSDVSAFTVERLVKMKQAREHAVDEARTPQRRQAEQEDLQWAGIVDEWASRVRINAWDGRMSNLVLDGFVREEVLDDLPRLNHWLLARVWPRTLPDLEAAFLNFRRIAQDLEAVVGRFGTRSSGIVWVDNVHKQRIYPRETYEFLKARSEYYRDLAADLTIELTRAVNLICDRVREHLWPSYRLEEGRTTIGLGYDPNLTFITGVPQYVRDAPAAPYPGLRRFVIERANRDFAAGSGPPPADVELPDGPWEVNEGGEEQTEQGGVAG